MKHSTLAVVLLIFSKETAAHYLFNRLIVNNTVSKEFQYIRDVSGNAGTYDSLWLKAFPIFGTTDANLTCGRGSFPVHNAATIETATIVAGSSVGFMVSPPFFEGDAQQPIYHDGPGQVFLSRLSAELSDLNSYDGRGDFFKIAYAGPENATHWSLMNQMSMNFSIPAATPSGKYLMRIEQFLASSERGQSQWFVNCAHVEIVGGGTGTPKEFVKFPGAYKDEDESVWFHEEGLGTQPTRLDRYVEPRPAVWRG